MALLKQNPHHVLLDPLQTRLAALFGGGLWTLRLPSALWGTAAVYGVWRLAREELDEARAGLASILTAVCLMHVDWSRRADFYAALPALAAFQTAALLRLRRDPSRWKAYAAWTAAFFLSHPYAVLLLPLHAVTLEEPRARRAAIRAWAWAGAAFLPWFLYSTRALLSVGLFHFHAAPGLATPRDFLPRLVLCLGQSAEVTTDTRAVTAAGAAFSLAYAGLFLVSALRRGPRPATLSLCRLAPPYGAAVVMSLDLAYRYYLAPRQGLWLLPFYAIGVADGAVWLLERAGKARWAPALAAALVAAWLPLYWTVTAAQSGVLSQLRGVVETLAGRARPRDVFRFRDDGVLAGFLYHYDEEAFRSLGGLALFERQGFLTYSVPSGLRARRGKADNAVELLRSDAPLAPAPRVWRFEGTLADLFIYPPADAPPVADSKP